MPIRKNEPDAGGEFGRDRPVLKELDFREGLELPDQEFGSHHAKDAHVRCTYRLLLSF